MAGPPTSLTRRNLLTGTPGAKTPPTSEIGARSQVPLGGDGWAPFVDEAERVPALAWPSSIETYHLMRSDSQIDSLHIGTVQPIREFRWSIDPNGAKPKLVERLRDDMGLAIRGEEDEPTERTEGTFDFDAFIADALLAPLYGFFDFEVVGKRGADGWRMTKLAPRHPRLTMDFRESNAGELEAIRQRIGGARQPLGMPEPIPASNLVRFVWRPEAGSHVGRSMLRSLYREWLVKDSVIRAGAINIQRGGGVPVVYGAAGASDKQIEDLAEMARRFKVAEGGAGALPFGSKLELAGGSVPDAISMLKYCDEAMARVWALMLVQLGTTSTGNRALGAEFAVYAARAQRGWAKWIKTSVDRFFDAYVEWNEPQATHAPLLVFEQSKPDAMSVTDLVSLISAGAITVDPELEEWLRCEYGLPEMPEPEEHEELGEITDDEKALILNSRNPPALPAALPPGAAPKPGEPGAPPPQLPKVALDPTAQTPTLAGGGTATAHPLGVAREYRGITASLTLPPRELRRPPSAGEIRAAVDFRGLDEAHSTATAKLRAEWLRDVLPAQIESMGATIRGLGAEGRLDASTLASLQAPALGKDILAEHLSAAAESGAQTARRELHAQGLPPEALARIPDKAALAQRIAPQIDALANLNANAVSLAAQRHAAMLLHDSRSPDQIASAVESRLADMKHVWEREQLRGAVTMAQNQGRVASFEAMPNAEEAAYEASELLDDATCDPCAAIDGTVFENLDEAEAAYAGGGYVDCEGGPNCRGTLIAVYPEQQTEVPGTGGLEEPGSPETQPEPSGGPTPEMIEPPEEAPPTEATPPEEAPPPEPERSLGPSVPEGLPNVIEHLDTITRADVEAGRVPGVTFDENLPSGVAGHAGLAGEGVRIGPSAFDDKGRINSTLMGHEAGHYLTSAVIKGGEVPPGMAHYSAGVGVDQPGTRYGAHGATHLFDNPFGGASRRPEEVIADGYSELLHGGAEFREVAGLDFPDEPGQYEIEKARFEESPKVAFLHEIAEAARLKGLPDHALYTVKTVDGEIVTLPYEPKVQPPLPGAAAARSGPEPGPLLREAEGLKTHDEAVAFLKDRVGIPGEVEFGDKLRKAATGNYKPGSQGEINQGHALDYIRQLAESVADARDVFGESARIDNIISDTRAKEVHRQINGRAKGIGNAAAAIRTWPSLGRNELIFKDSQSFEKLVAKDGYERTGGFVSKATSDPRGIIMHEMGHSLENGLPGLRNAFPSLLADSGLASTAQGRGTARFVSRYATTASYETWAESFATLMKPGGVAEDFTPTVATDNLQVQRMMDANPEARARIEAQTANADAETKASLVALRENFNKWLAEHHPDVPPMPER